MAINDPTVAEIVYRKHFKIACRLEPAITGLIVNVALVNETLSNRNSTPNVEVWFPINGHLEYTSREGQTKSRAILDSLYELGDVSETSTERDLFLKPGTNRIIIFFTKIDLQRAERIREIAERDGVVQLTLHLYFASLYAADTIKPKTYAYHSVLKFIIPKLTIVEWLTKWSTWYAESEHLPSAVPRNVVADFAEAVAAYNVNAFKASAAMSRRALQQALEDKGAKKGDSLFDQVNELKQNELIDSATASLAHGVRHFGNFGAHPQDDLLSQIDTDEAKLSLDVVKKILKELYK